MCWFSEDVLTLPVQQTMILQRLLHRITSCRSAAATPTGFYVPAEIVHDRRQNLLNVAVQHTL